MAISRVSQSTVKQGLDKSQTFTAGIPPILGKFYHMGTVEVGAGGASTIEFTNIPAIYKHLQIRTITRGTSADLVVDLQLRVGNSTIDSGSNYSCHVLYGNGTGAYSSGYSSQNKVNWIGMSTAGGSASGVFGSSIINILDYSSTYKNLTISCQSGRENNGSGTATIHSGLWMNTAQITNVQLFLYSGNFSEYSTAALYGVK